MRKDFFTAVVAILLLAAGSCGVPKPKLVAREVYTHPEINFGDYKDVAVYVDLANLPWENRNPFFISAIENALVERGFGISSDSRDSSISPAGIKFGPTRL